MNGYIFFAWSREMISAPCFRDHCFLANDSSLEMKESRNGEQNLLSLS